MRRTAGRHGRDRDQAATGSPLTSAAPRLPFVLCLRIADRLPLQVRDRIRTATDKREDMVFDVTWARAACTAGCRTWVHQLELALDRGRSRLFGRSGGWQNDADRKHGANEQSGRHTAGDPRTGIVNAASSPQSVQRPGGVMFTSCPIASIIRRQIASPVQSPFSANSSARSALSMSASSP
jgi:hypothetical protein